MLAGVSVAGKCGICGAKRSGKRPLRRGKGEKGRERRSAAMMDAGFAEKNIMEREFLC